MSVVEHFRKEHELIGRVLTALEVYTGRMEAGEALEKKDLASLVAFFREYADLGHHEKEESLLLPALVELGESWDDGAVGGVRKEHNQERYLLRSLRQSALQTAEWSIDDRTHVLNLAHEFVAFARRHAQLEEDVLLPIVASKMSADAQNKLEHRLQHFDEHWAEKAWLEELGEELSERYSRS